MNPTNTTGRAEPAATAVQRPTQNTRDTDTGPATQETATPGATEPKAPARERPAPSRRFRFSEKAVDALPPNPADSPSREAEFSDTEVRGLRLLVSKGGRKTYFLRYVRDGRKRCDRVGEHGPLTVADARRRALELKRELGRDPRDLLRTRADDSCPTFREFAEREYLPHARANKRSARSDESKLRVHLFPRFGEKRLTEVTTAEVQRYHDETRARKAPATANRHLSLLHRMFRLAVLWGRLERNPADGVRKHQENNRRERFLSEDEIARVLAATAEDPNRAAMGLFRLLLTTGTRLGEALAARWEHVDLDRATWTLPQTKAGRARAVVLNESAVAVLRDLLPLRQPGNPFVFPGEKKGRAMDAPRKAWRRLLARAGVAGVRIHDLRHTFASIAVSRGATLFEVQKLLEHHCSVTTERYAHLADASLRRASATVSGAVETAARANGNCSGNAGVAGK
jgi:integrase